MYTESLMSVIPFIAVCRWMQAIGESTVFSSRWKEVEVSKRR